MNLNSFGYDWADEQILIDDLSDEALERAGLDSGRAALSIGPLCQPKDSCEN
jgi:hypothetical protein